MPGLLAHMGEDTAAVKDLFEAVGKSIKHVRLGQTIELVFEDDSALCFVDNGQQCCEERYFESDDDLTRMIGSWLMWADLREAEQEAEVCFLDIQTSSGLFQFKAYNIHNGYYAGFGITCYRLDRLE